MINRQKKIKDQNKQYDKIAKKEEEITKISTIDKNLTTFISNIKTE